MTLKAADRIINSLSEDVKPEVWNCKTCAYQGTPADIWPCSHCDRAVKIPIKCRWKAKPEEG